MIRISIKGKIENIESSNNKFSTIYVRQKNSPSDVFEISVLTEKKEEYGLKKGLVIDSLCNLRGCNGYVNIYLNWCKTAISYKSLDDLTE